MDETQSLSADAVIQLIHAQGRDLIVPRVPPMKPLIAACDAAAAAGYCVQTMFGHSGDVMRYKLALAGWARYAVITGFRPAA